MRSAVLFLVFNRPESTRKVFDAIRAARPTKLYVAADGPRSSRPGEAKLCSEVREIAVSVDWPCEVKTLFRDGNLGCRAGVSTGISWFFSHEEEGIILEDDVLPISTFFPFCDELLELYRNDPRISMISGSNLISNYFTPGHSYFFSRYTHIWGWASWRRAWQHYDVTMAQWPRWRDGHSLEAISGGRSMFTRHWRSIFDAVYDGRVDTWDYQWTFAIWQMGGLTVLPAVNQTDNLGFGADATHTTDAAPQYVVASRPALLKWPLAHPNVVKRNVQADQLIDTKVYGVTMVNLIRRHLRRFRAFAGSGFSKRAATRHAFAVREPEQHDAERQNTGAGDAKE